MDHDDYGAGGDLRERLRAEMARRGWSQAEAARRCEGVSQTALNQWLGGKYTGDNDAMAARIVRFLGSLAEGERVVSRRVASPAWLRTPTADTVWTMLTQAQFAPDVVVIAGAPGLGKTMTARAYQAASSNVWLASMDPDLASPVKMMTEISIELGLRCRSASMLRREIGERIDGSGGLLAIDEAQYLTRASLDMLRTLHDRYRIGVALIGNHGFYGGTSGVGRADNFAQFFSRVGMRRRLEAPDPRDVELLLDAWAVSDAASRRFLTSISGKPGALRAIDKTIKAAAAIAAGAGETMSAAHLKAAWAANA